MAKKKRNKKYNPPGRRRNQFDEPQGGDDTLLDVVEVKEHAQDFFERNQTAVLSVLVGALILIGGYLGYKYGIQEPNNRAAMEAIHRAQFQFQRDSFALALENPGPDADGFLDIIDSYGSTKVGNLAKYYAGVSYLNLGSYEAAIEYLENFSPADDVTPAMKYGAIADAMSELGDLDGAMSNYKKAANYDQNELISPYYLYKLGMLQYKQGDKAGATASFEKIKSDYPGSQLATDIDKYIKLASS